MLGLHRKFTRCLSFIRILETNPGLHICKEGIQMSDQSPQSWFTLLLNFKCFAKKKKGKSRKSVKIVYFQVSKGRFQVLKVLAHKTRSEICGHNFGCPINPKWGICMQGYTGGEAANHYVTVDLDLTKGLWSAWCQFFQFGESYRPQHFPSLSSIL